MYKSNNTSDIEVERIRLLETFGGTVSSSFEMFGRNVLFALIMVLVGGDTLSWDLRVFRYGFFTQIVNRNRNYAVITENTVNLCVTVFTVTYPIVNRKP